MKKYVDIRDRRKIPWFQIATGLTGLALGSILAILTFQKEIITLNEVMMGAVVLAVSMILSATFHEIGHLVTGLLSGYEALIFRIGTLAVVSDEEARFGFAVKKAAMTSFGDCIMCPPEEEDYQEVPYELYLRGGGIGNLVSIPVSALFLIPFWDYWYVIAAFALVALVFALTSLIPLKIDGRPNDGYIKKLCDATWDDHSSFVNQLQIINAYYQGTSIGDMPETWFFGKFSLSDRMSSNPLTVAIWHATADRFLVQGELFQAKIIYESIGNQTALSPLTQQNGMYGLLYTMILEGRVEETRIHPIPKFMRRSVKKLVKKYTLYPRFQYGYAMLVSESGKKMKEAMAKFEKIAAVSHLEGQIEDERLLMERLEDVKILR